MPEAEDFEGRAFAFDNAVRVLEGQNARVDSIDGKAGVLLAADGVLAGFLVSQDSLLLKGPKCLAILVIAMVFISALLALFAFWPRTYKAAPAAQAVADAAAGGDSHGKLKWDYIGNVLESIAHNKTLLTQKVWLLRFAGASLAFTLLLLGIGLGLGVYEP